MSNGKYPEGYAENVGANIQENRKRLGLSQVQLGERVSALGEGYSLRNHQVSAYENGDNVPPVHILEGMAIVFGIKVDDLLKKNESFTRQKIPYGDIWNHQEEICRLYTEEKLSMETIGERFNTSYSTIYRVLVENNVETRSR